MSESDPQNHHKPKFRYLRRTLYLDQNNPKLLQKASSVKYLHFKSVSIKANYNNEYLSNLQEHRYTKPKAFKSLTHLNISTFEKLYWLKILQHSKALTSFHQPFIYAKKDHIFQYFRKLPKKIKNIEIRLYKNSEWTRPDLFPIYRSLAFLRDLTVFRRYFSSDASHVETAVVDEYQLIRQYTSRLKKLKDFDYEQTFYDQIGIHKIMKGNQVYPQITSLTHISSFQRSESFFEALDSEDSAELEEDSSSSSFKSSQKQRHYLMNNQENFIQNGGAKRIFTLDQQYKNLLDAEIIPLYSFNIFPNLTNLSFLITHNCLYPLGDFVIQGFKSLKNLQKFNLVLNTRPHGTSFLFKAASFLQSLHAFSLEITFIEAGEWKLLEDFFQRQKSLVSISLSVSRQRSTKTGYIQQNKHIENYLWRYLKNKPNLKYLKLKSTSWSLESISNTLEKVTGVQNQLKCLEIEGLDDTITSTKNAQRRVKGLCEFLLRQRDSLTHFRIDLPLIFEVEVFNYIAETIAKMAKLEDLEIYMTNGDLSIDYFLIYFQEVIQENNRSCYGKVQKPQKKLKMPKSWDLKVAKMLQELENLESFTFDFGIMEDLYSKPSKWFGDIFKMNCLSKRLSNLAIRASSTIAYDMVERIEGTLGQLKRLRSVSIEVEGEDFVKQKLDSVMEKVCEKQAMKTDLMF